MANFGPIAEGTVTMAPLVVLVGKNGTGKSYLASLLWALLSNDGFFTRSGGRQRPALPPWLTAYIERTRQPNAPLSATLTVRRAQDWINRHISKNIDRELARLFSSTAVTADLIDVRLQPQRALKLRHQPLNDDDEEDAGAIASWHFQDGGSALHFSTRPDFQLAALGPFNSAIRKLLLGRLSANSDCIYVPAARTGLILALGSLISDSLGSLAAAEERPRTTLPLPTVRFLQSLGQSTRQYTRYRAVSAFLEAAILHGQIGEVSDKEAATPEYYFDDPRAGKLPLYVTSSMVTELAPILIAMRKSIASCFVIEEPEAHLHLSAQRQMARAIVRLVNAGASVVITTHSDTFLQQLNLSISLGAGTAKETLMEKYGYESVDTLAPGNARCYEFLETEVGSIIREAEASEDGFAVTSINAPLYELADEVIDVQQSEDDG